MPQQLYWYARSEDHQKSEEYSLKIVLNVACVLMFAQTIFRLFNISVGKSKNLGN